MSPTHLLNSSSLVTLTNPSLEALEATDLSSLASPGKPNSPAELKLSRSLNQSLSRSNELSSLASPGKPNSGPGAGYAAGGVGGGGAKGGAAVAYSGGLPTELNLSHSST